MGCISGSINLQSGAAQALWSWKMRRCLNRQLSRRMKCCRKKLDNCAQLRAGLIVYAGADILIFVARERSSVRGGRKDGRTSRESDDLLNLPPPSANVQLLVQSFSRKGLSLETWSLSQAYEKRSTSRSRYELGWKRNFEQVGSLCNELPFANPRCENCVFLFLVFSSLGQHCAMSLLAFGRSLLEEFVEVQTCRSLATCICVLFDVQLAY
ncbi:hypothetical protein Vadar_015725 [Vaccinium darrowii]|uniref:Uncharacterized protein n=1 Tax=Vaccinium darrowii TaxID=229202 RepID=A0ACB7YDX7_9ERIC|nr:hypothetical protein Vadar_015725 [Vaccinium darrowii]